MDVLNGSLPSVSNSMTSGSQDIQFPRAKDRDREQSGATKIPGEMISDLLHQVDPHKSMGPHGIHPRLFYNSPMETLEGRATFQEGLNRIKD